jgi:hypothetical protein
MQMRRTGDESGALLDYDLQKECVTLSASQQYKCCPHILSLPWPFKLEASYPAHQHSARSCLMPCYALAMAS